MDEKIISLYARGLTTSEIKGHLEEIYGVDVSPVLISNITGSFLDEVRAWQSRLLEAVYPILYHDALKVKVKRRTFWKKSPRAGRKACGRFASAS